MATNLPPPPFLGPLRGVPVRGTYPDWVNLLILRWNAADQAWAEQPWGVNGWQNYPLGYYVSEHLEIDGNVDYGPHTDVIVVMGRSDPNGVAQPFVLDQPPAGQAPDSRCPPNMWWTNVGDTFNTENAVTLCSWLPPQSTTQVCPPGTHWDPATETCVANTVPPLPIPIPPSSPPPPPPAPIVGQPDPYGDEITQTLCAQMAANAAAIVTAINSLAQPGANSDACCAAVVTAIGSITNTLGLILNLLASRLSAGGAPLDLTPVVTELTAIAQSLAAIATAPALDLTPLQIAINDVAKAIANAPPTDVQGIIDQLKQFNQTYDVSPALIQALKDANYIAPKDAHLFQGMGPPDADFASRWTSWRSLWRGLVLGAVGVDIDTGSLTDPTGAQAAKWITDGIKSGLNLSDAVLAPILTPFIDTIKAQIKPGFIPPVGGAGVNLDKPVQSAISLTATSALTMYLLSFFGVDGGEPLDKFTDLVSGFIGYEQLKDVQIGPLVSEGLAQIARQQARALFQQNLPGSGQIAGWVARGLMTSAAAAKLYPLNGLHNTLSPIAEKAAQSGFNARQMLRLIETGLFTNQDIADELTFAGMRPVSQHRMLLAAPYLATAAQRNQARSALENSYKEGLLSDLDLTSNLDSLEQNTDRDSLILFALHQDVATSSTKELVAEYASLFKAGVWTDTQYRAQLAGLGLQQWKIDLEAGKAEAAANVATFKKNLAEAAALERATAAEERKAAMQAFKAGTTNAAGLAGALTLTGLTPTQAAAWVALATLQQAGSLRWIYGVLKSPAEAALLRGRVTALADQRKRLQIDDGTFVGALQALGIPNRYINSLRAATDAMISPKTAAVTIPVSTT